MILKVSEWLEKRGPMRKHLTKVHINYGAPQKVRENICGHLHIISTRRKILFSKFSKIPTDFDLQNKTMI